MRIGIMMGPDRVAHTIDKIVAMSKQAEAAGLDNVWMANIRAHDAITALAIAGRETTRIGVGTAVTPSYPRHPIALAQQALTAAAATKGRFTLGIGLSHKVVIEHVHGLSYAQPANHMQEYLAILMPLLRGETATHEGKHYRVQDITLGTPDAQPPPVVLAALGPLMLKLAGTYADGTNTWMVGSRTMKNHIVKRIAHAAAEAGKKNPLIVGGFPVVVTDNPKKIKQALAEPLALYGQLPRYRAMLDLEGVSDPTDLAIVGNESQVLEKIQSFRHIGVTDFMAAIFELEADAFERTLALLSAAIN
ncbi:MAG TPA: LLM class F420-dependent oxidoreductase [Gammaproteobacteria bacterium]|nr:LLM class F420-dependent oxidoreductase [Gammaproteobacteria bacterium]